MWYKIFVIYLIHSLWLGWVIAVHGFFVAVCRLLSLWHTGWVSLLHGASYFPDQGSNTWPPHWKRRFLTTGLAGKSNTPIFTGTARVKFQPTISQLECIAWAPLLSLPSPLKCVTYLWGPGGAEPNGHLTALAYFRSKVIRYSSVSQTRLRRTYNGVTSLLQG